MSQFKELTHFLYGKGFWYADPLREINGLSEEQLFWVPNPNSLCALWHVGHIAHREHTHLGFLQTSEPKPIPAEFEVFGTDWCSPKEVRESIDALDPVYQWVRKVRSNSHDFIDGLKEIDLYTVPPSSEFGFSIAKWLSITTAHTALHIGRIQMLRAMLQNSPERPC